VIIKYYKTITEERSRIKNKISKKLFKAPPAGGT
jgi:hypothetical protein